MVLIVLDDPTVTDGSTGSYIVAGMALFGTIATIFFTWLRFRRTQSAEDQNRGYDQLQEDLAAARLEIAALRVEVATEKRERKEDSAQFRAELRIKDNYIGVLRTHINQAKSPPPPDWPPQLLRGEAP